MNCDGVRGLLSAYVDGELSAGELLRVEQHLRRCHWCADEVDALRQAIALVASLEEVEVPATFHVQLHERLVALGPPVQAVRTAPAHRARRQDFRRWAVPAAAAAALVIGVAGLNRITPLSSGPNVPTVPISSSAGPTETPTKTNPALVATKENPESTGGTTTSNNPPEQQNASGDPESNQTPPVDNTEIQPNPTTPSNEPVDKPSVGETNTNNKGPRVASTSFTKNVNEPSATTQKQLGATLTATVADPSATAAELKKHFGSAVTELRAPGSTVVKLQVTVAASAFDTELAYLQNATGVQAETYANDLTDQMNDAYKKIYQLEQQREQIENSLTGETDAAAIALAEKNLKALAEEAEAAKVDYQKLVDQSASGIIEITLKPNQVR